MNGTQPKAQERGPSGRLLALLILLAAALGVLCRQDLPAHHVFWANDGPLGSLKAASARLPGTFFGHWQTENWIGSDYPASAPSLTTLLLLVTSPETFLKVYAPLSMLLLGFSAWTFFRASGFSALAAVLGGLAAGLNMHFFSNACWGLGQWNISFSMVYLALAALVTKSIRQTWIKGTLAGLAVGMSVMEGFDAGAILSIYIAVFMVFFFWITESNLGAAITKSAIAGVLMVVFALLISAATLVTLVGTQITGVGGTGQSPQEKAAHWDFATQWSIPKLETLRVIIPGIFGYRMMEFITSPDKSSSYWGSVAEDPKIGQLQSGDPEVRATAAANLGMPAEYQKVFKDGDPTQREQIVDALRGRLQRRHSGSGEYAGVLVAVLAIFGIANAFRRAASPFSATERKLVWFWTGAALFSLVAAWGRYAFLYHWLYQLPYFSTIRNPMKFMHPFHIIWIILAGYGAEALVRRYMENTAVKRIGFFPQYLLNWWGKTSGFEKKWVAGSLLAVAVSVVALVVLGASRPDLIKYLQKAGFSEDLAPQIAVFCFNELIWFIIYLIASVATLTCILSGILSGSRAKWAWIPLCAIMIFDLGRSDVPWVRCFDYTQVYSMNPVVDFLRHDPYEHRVVSRLSPMGPYDITGDSNLGALCHWWIENDYLYNDIQCLEIDQAPRMPVNESAYLGTFTVTSGNDVFPAVRLWQLTNTRYILAAKDAANLFNQRGGVPPDSFRLQSTLSLAIKPGVTQIQDAGDLTLTPDDKGGIALIEFTRALPRAKLYADWQTANDDRTALGILSSRQFNPAHTVLISSETPLPTAPANPNADPGTVTISSYKPKDVVLQADAKTPSVLLLNDQIHPAWNAWVDQKPASVLRCNYMMRGVFLPPGQHTVEFRFQPAFGMLYVSLSAFAVGIGLAIYLIWSHRKFEP